MNINWDTLEIVSTCDVSAWFEYVKNQGFDVRMNERGLYYGFKDNNADILAVAHCDVVRPSMPIKFSMSRRAVYTRGLDDRLGVFGIGVLGRMGKKFDILFTDGEESCASTAEDALADVLKDKKYNWTFSLDRAGTDVVLYQYETKELRDCIARRRVAGWCWFIL